MKFTLVEEKTEIVNTEKQGLKNLVPDYYKNSFELHNNYMDDKQALKLAVDLFATAKGFVYESDFISKFVHGLSYEFIHSELGEFTAHFSFVGGYTIKGDSRIGLIRVFNTFRNYFDFAKEFQTECNDKLKAKRIEKECYQIEVPSRDKF
jgi:hypothetical protein